MNIWTDINWIRPSIVFKNSNYKYWEDIIVIPITSYEKEQEDSKSVSEFDIKIEANKTNWLSHDSLIKIRQLRAVSKKRFKTNKKWIIKIIWEVEVSLRGDISGNIRRMLWV